jgi:N-acetylneuraminic acid mutarotase
VPTDSGVSAATPDDGALPDGFYWLFSTQTGNHDFTASKSHYATATELVDVAANAVTRQDFALAAGRIEVSPAALSGTVTLGGATSATATLTNTGTQQVHVKIGERDGGFQIAGRPAAKAYAKTRGAAVQRVKGHFSPLKLKPRHTKPPARHNRQPADPPWEPIADFPTPISSNSASFFDGKLYSVGGFQGFEDIASLYVYDPDTKAWTKLADMSEAREAPGSAWINGKLYVADGWDPDGNPTTATEVYDPATNSWSTLADNPRPHAAAGAAVIDNQLYLVGGCDATSCGSTDVEIYDPATDSWSPGTDYPMRVSWESCGGIDGVLYCAGGVNDDAETAAGFAYDGNAWTPIADLPSDDWGAAYTAANGQLLVSGGIVQGNSAVTNQGWAYDPGTADWTSLPNANDAFFRLGGACGFYRIGGNDDAGNPQAKASVLPGFDSCGTVDVGWLSEDPVETDVAAGQSVNVTVTMDSADLAQPGTYKASLVFSTDSPYPVTPVQITFTVNPPKTWAKISGVVSGKACSGTVAPIPGATVQIDTRAASYTLITDSDGKYALWLDKRNNPLTLIVAKDGWQPQTRKVRVKPGSPLTANFTLLPAKPCK